MPATTETLARKKCAPCAHDAAAMNDAQIAPMLQAVPGWQRDGTKITREYPFQNHYQAQAFANAVMWISHQEDHHPCLVIGYNTVKVEYWTHSVGGLSENDFICAAKVNTLLGQ
jgi:4a-hydroxytetrahydrobiopterin dehydratase